MFLLINMKQMKKVIIQFSWVICFIFISSKGWASTPVNLEETYKFLDLYLADSTKSKLIIADENEANVILHLLAGNSIRKKLDLWNKNSKLRLYFNGLGNMHPYHITDVIFTCYIRYLKQIPENIEALRNFYIYNSGTVIYKFDTAYFPDDFFSLRENYFAKSNLKKLFAIGDTILINDEVGSWIFPVREPPSILGRVESISGDSLNIRILKIKNKRKYPKKMKPGIAYPYIYNEGELFVPRIENCGYLPTKGIEF
jgi:hypothetical protein